MAILKIRTWGDPGLKNKTKPVEKVTPEIRQLAADMFETLSIVSGVGLAANQVGVPLQLFVAEIIPQVGPAQRYAVLNPRMEGHGQETETIEEGCLSFPGIYGPVERYTELTISGEDLDGKKITLTGTGLLARAFQHELDHLAGMVFIERIPLVNRVMLNRALRELAKETHAALAGHATPRI